MTAERLTMRQIREVLRLKWALGYSDRQTASACGVSRPAIKSYLRRARAAGLQWPLPEGLDDPALEQRLFPPAVRDEAPRQRPLPDVAAMHQELRRKGVTLMLLWEEYKAGQPDGLQYSQYCEHYRRWVQRIKPSMRQVHRAGEKCFVDYAGQTVAVRDPYTGEPRQAQVFVAVLGASHYCYAEATWSQSLPDWIASHQRALHYFGGVPELLVPDNLASGVTRAHRYEPILNPTYREMATHYGTAILPARVRKPRDKAKVETAVQLVERWILARVRHRQFFSLTELNAEIATLLEHLNTRALQVLPGTRRSQFEQIDRPALRSLPTTHYVFAEWKHARVHIDYHIAVDDHYYSVPYSLIGQQLDVRLSAHTVEVFQRGQRVASHVRSPDKGRHTTVAEHMPTSHREYAHWTPTRLIAWAGQTGVATARLIELVMTRRTHPQQGFRACLGIMRLGKTYGDERLEAASVRALQIGAHSYRSLESILRRGLDQQSVALDDSSTPSPAHDNVRGPGYYH
jgi:transposase